MKGLIEGIEVHSPEQMQALAMEWAQALPEQVCLALHGDLGTGKTCFVQGLAKAWGITGVSSPTYTLYGLYTGKRQLCHLDAYRLEGPEAYADLLIDELLVPPYCLAIEWPERLGQALPSDAWHLDFNILSPGNHHIQKRGKAPAPSPV